MGRLIKRLTFVGRAPGVAAEDFGAAWRQQAERAVANLNSASGPGAGGGSAPEAGEAAGPGAGGGSAPGAGGGSAPGAGQAAGPGAGEAAAPGAPPGGLRRLALCVVRPGRGTPLCDGVALEWFEDAAAMARWDDWVASQGSARTEAVTSGPAVVDEASISHLLVEERTVLGESWLDARWNDARAGPALVLIGLIEAASGLSRPAFRDYWWDRHRPLANQMVPSHLEPVAYVHNYVRPDEPGRWAGVGEMYERSLDTARGRGAWFESDEAVPLVADENRFLVRHSRELLVADQYVITGG